jgi:hypothetical protein
VLPRDFDTIEIPYPERGEPELIHWQEGVPEAVDVVADPSS